MDKDTSSKAASNIGSRIRYQRKLHNMSQEKLALAASMNPAFIGHLERGEKSPTVATLEKLTHALDISLGELFSDSVELDCDNDRSMHYERIRLILDKLSDEDVAAVSDIIFRIIQLKGKP